MTIQACQPDGPFLHFFQLIIENPNQEPIAAGYVCATNSMYLFIRSWFRATILFRLVSQILLQCTSEF